jgi:large subunit ribosomal protein L31
MRKDIHPIYREVLFVDNEFQFLVNSSIETNLVGVHAESKIEYPLVRITISSATHPLWTGVSKLLDTQGRMQKFASKYAQNNQLQAAVLAKKEEADKAKHAKTPKKK